MNKKILIIGGAGFIGTNASIAFAKKNWQVTVLDNLMRKGAKSNLDWLQQQADIIFIKADIREYEKLIKVFKGSKFDAVIHLAAQVAVTTSVNNPREDFEINALGTFNVLECIRLYCNKALLIYASTNKVYGKMKHELITERDGRYEYQNIYSGIDESQSLDFHSPYGCSKGAGDQYVIDYSRIYGLQTTSFRQSCIYGPHQFGVEDQGWVAWFSIATILGIPITIYGDGKQIRDVLHVDDLIKAYEMAISNFNSVSGQVFNIGGGPLNTLSLLELIQILEKRIKSSIHPSYDDWRPGDQKVFVCNLEKAKKSFQWEPKIGVQDGVNQLIDWIIENKDVVRHHF